ncbi:MAG: hypothetical protein EZS28_000848 [Streblomastix strix]|uniref:Uncharacterized protein n=1 Tax=Streblomastix strix TaxID=222440 RepID=A0A5J4X9Q6_9EUKA|nr:MAG: hypothetical protein EZS28_000848 [Streblomastix strix]
MDQDTPGFQNRFKSQIVDLSNTGIICITIRQIAMTDSFTTDIVGTKFQEQLILVQDDANDLEHHFYKSNLTQSLSSSQGEEFVTIQNLKEKLEILEKQNNELQLELNKAHEELRQREEEFKQQLEQEEEKHKKELQDKDEQIDELKKQNEKLSKEALPKGALPKGAIPKEAPKVPSKQPITKTNNKSSGAPLPAAPSSAATQQLNKPKVPQINVKTIVPAEPKKQNSYSARASRSSSVQLEKKAPNAAPAAPAQTGTSNPPKSPRTSVQVTKNQIVQKTTKSPQSYASISQQRQVQQKDFTQTVSQLPIPTIEEEVTPMSQKIVLNQTTIQTDRSFFASPNQTQLSPRTQHLRTMSQAAQTSPFSPNVTVKEQSYRALSVEKFQLQTVTDLIFNSPTPIAANSELLAKSLSSTSLQEQLKRDQERQRFESTRLDPLEQQKYTQTLEKLNDARLKELSALKTQKRGLQEELIQLKKQFRDQRLASKKKVDRLRSRIIELNGKKTKEDIEDEKEEQEEEKQFIERERNFEIEEKNIDEQNELDQQKEKEEEKKEVKLLKDRIYILEKDLNAQYEKQRLLAQQIEKLINFVNQRPDFNLSTRLEDNSLSPAALQQKELLRIMRELGWRKTGSSDNEIDQDEQSQQDKYIDLLNKVQEMQQEIKDQDERKETEIKERIQAERERWIQEQKDEEQKQKLALLEREFTVDQKAEFDKLRAQLAEYQEKLAQRVKFEEAEFVELKRVWRLNKLNKLQFAKLSQSIGDQILKEEESFSLLVRSFNQGQASREDNKADIWGSDGQNDKKEKDKEKKELDQKEKSKK